MLTAQNTNICIDMAIKSLEYVLYGISDPGENLKEKGDGIAISTCELILALGGNMDDIRVMKKIILPQSLREIEPSILEESKTRHMPNKFLERWEILKEGFLDGIADRYMYKISKTGMEEFADDLES